MSSAGTVSVLASTTVSDGRYSFNLTSLGLTFTSDLAVRVANGPVQMRAFVTGGTVNLDPVSETAVRMILEQIAVSPETALSSFTPQELRDLVGALDLLTTTNQTPGGASIETTVTAIKQSATANTGLMAFLTAAARVGDTEEGPGDIGNYFSFTQGNVWRFQGTKSGTGQQQPVNFVNTAMITGTKTFAGGLTATVFTETDPDGNGQEEEDYLLKDSRGITNHGNNDATDLLTPNLIPFREVRFPLQQGATFESVNKTGVNFGDLTRDGKNETGDVLAQVTVAAFETVTVPAGTFANSAKIEATITSTLTLSDDGSRVTITAIQTDWLAPGVGPVKRRSQTSGLGLTETVTEELVKFTPAFRFTSVSAARDHTCALMPDGTAYCWGAGGSGQLGDGTTIASATPMLVSGGLTFSSVSAGGSSHTCGIVTAGGAYCWGFGDQGQLGNGSTTLPAPSSATPVPVVGGLTFKSISAGGTTSHGHTCGITTSGDTYCWGFGIWGQLGNGSTDSTATPVLVSGGLTFASIRAGVSQTCGVTISGAAYCWGYNQFGQLGNGTTTNSPTPVPVSGGLTFTAVSPGDFHTCAVRTNGAAACWGSNGSGQFGNGTTTNSSVPMPVSGGLTFTSINAGASVFSQGYTCGIITNGATYCWGGNGAGPLGNGTTTDSPTPVPVSGGLTFASLSAGRDYVCGVTTSGWSAYCWGYNLSGQLGTGTSQSSNVPIRVSPPS
jgi:alpha-tubulin suppressor-like RCC1 family protein